LLEQVQVVAHTVRGRDLELLADLADGGRRPLLTPEALDEGIDLAGAFVEHHQDPSRMGPRRGPGTPSTILHRRAARQVYKVYVQQRHSPSTPASRPTRARRIRDECPARTRAQPVVETRALGGAAPAPRVLYG